MRTYLLAALALGVCGTAQASPSAPSLVPAVQIDRVVNGVTTTRDGRVFVVLQLQKPGTGPEVGELAGGKLKPFPDEDWNHWQPGDNPAGAFVGVNALRVGPDGDLWIVDKGAAGDGELVLTGGPKLVDIDLSDNTVRKIYPLDKVATDHAYVDDIRFHGRNAYLTDAGAHPGLIVVDLETRAARRVLTDHASMLAQRPLTGEGRPLIDPHGQPVVINADQLEVSPDGTWLYYQPCTGPMSRIETRYLDNPALTDEQLAQHVLPFADTHSTGGTAIDAAGNLYASDTDHDAILKISPAGVITTLVRDPRLVWADAMWIDAHGDLWIPAAQMNRIASHDHGVASVRYPETIFRYHLGIAGEEAATPRVATSQRAAEDVLR